MRRSGKDDGAEPDVLVWDEPAWRRSPRSVLRQVKGTALSGLLSFTALWCALAAGMWLSGEVASLLHLALLLAAGLALTAALAVGPPLLTRRRVTAGRRSLLREGGGHRDEWPYAEMRDVTLVETTYHGERRELLRFRTADGAVEQVILPWRLDGGRLRRLIRAAQDEA